MNHTPSLPKSLVLETINVLDAMLVHVSADSILRLRAIAAREDLRGRLMAAVPERIEVDTRDAA